MKIRNIMLLALVVFITAATATSILSEHSNNVEVTLKTNGTNVEVQSSSVLFFSRIPQSMKMEMEKTALDDVYNDNSTVHSLKDDMKEIAQKYNYNVTVTIDSQFGKDQLPMIATVEGTSMVPTLQDGQNVVLVKTKDFKVGDIVVARHPTHGLIVKRVAQIRDGQTYLMSDNREVVVRGNTIFKGLDTWLPIENVVGVVKDY